MLSFVSNSYLHRPRQVIEVVSEKIMLILCFQFSIIIFLHRIKPCLTQLVLICCHDFHNISCSPLFCPIIQAPHVLSRAYNCNSFTPHPYIRHILNYSGIPTIPKIIHNCLWYKQADRRSQEKRWRHNHDTSSTWFIRR